jgi:dCMP deaminase
MTAEAQGIAKSLAEKQGKSLADKPQMKMTEDPETLRIAKSLCLLAEEQGKSLADKPQLYCARGDGACVITKVKAGDWNILSLRYAGMVHESSFKGHPAATQQNLMCHAVMNAVVSAGERRENLEECSVYCRANKQCEKCEELVKVYYNKEISSSCNKFNELVVVNLKDVECCLQKYDEGVIEKFEGIALLKSGSSQSEQSFFPLAIDDYFMTVAILTGTMSQIALKKEKEKPERGSCCIVVTHEPPCVVSSSTQAKCPEICAVSRAQRSQVDLTKCILYTTKSPCLECTKVILQAGIRVVVHGEGYPEEIKDLVYQTKACFKKYCCYIRVVKNEDKKFLINLNECIVHAKKLQYEGPPPAPTPSQPVPHENDDDMKKPTYRDFFMAMAFLASARSKDNVTQVGACLVTQAPHRLVAMGYNGMPDGRGFKDEKMDWGSNQSNYICHAELNTIIAAFRRSANLSSCTLYVTHSPCEDCSKLIAQSGIKNVVFAKYYKEGKHMYKCLGHTPDMNITHYEYKDSGYGNGAKIRIDLERLKVTTTESTEPPDRGRREVNLPLDDYFMALAVLATTRSPYATSEWPNKDPVGACIVLQEPRRAISVGYNGLPESYKGKRTTTEDYNGMFNHGLYNPLLCSIYHFLCASKHRMLC